MRNPTRKKEILGKKVATVPNTEVKKLMEHVIDHWGLEKEFKIDGITWEECKIPHNLFWMTRLSLQSWVTLINVDPTKLCVSHLQCQALEIKYCKSKSQVETKIKLTKNLNFLKLLEMNVSEFQRNFDTSQVKYIKRVLINGLLPWRRSMYVADAIESKDRKIQVWLLHLQYVLITKSFTDAFEIYKYYIISCGIKFDALETILKSEIMIDEDSVLIVQQTQNKLFTSLWILGTEEMKGELTELAQFHAHIKLITKNKDDLKTAKFGRKYKENCAIKLGQMYVKLRFCSHKEECNRFCPNLNV